MISPEAFWERLRTSGLVSPEKLDSVRAKVETKPAIAESAQQIARVLVSNKLITATQAKGLFARQSAPKTEVRLADVTADAPAVTPAMPYVEVDASQEKETPATRTNWPLLLGVLSVIISIAVAATFASKLSFRANEPAQGSSQQTALSAGTIGASENSSSLELPYELVESDSALWNRPRLGEPLEIPYLPAGTQMIVSVRLADLHQADPEWRLLRSMGPQWMPMLNEWLQRLGLRPEQLQRLSLYFLPQGTTYPRIFIQGVLADDRSAVFAHLVPELKDSEAALPEYLKLSSQGMWLPDEFPQHFYFGLWEHVRMFSQSNAGRLGRNLGQLLRHTHDSDTLTILANPRFLQSEASGLLADRYQRLLPGLFAFWSDQALAVSVGYQHQDIAFLEARMIAREELPPRHLAARIQGFLDELPTQTRDFLGQATLDPHWQPLAMRFPEMLGYVVERSRIQTEGREVAVTTIGPQEATHNLLLASELALATPTSSLVLSSGAGGSEQPAGSGRAGDSPLRLSDLLQAKMTVRFAQKSLDEAAQDIAEQVRDQYRELDFSFQIQVNGADLQPEGITRNQQIRGFEAVDAKMADVLTALVRQANPDPAVESARDPNQKLVWVASEAHGRVEITTRNAANTKGIELPAAFRE